MTPMTPMTSETKATPQGEERRQGILSHSIDVFGESGYAGARIDEVARRVGIRRPSVLYHFPEKRSLYEAAIRNIVEDIVGRVVATETEPRDRLEAIADTWIDFVIARPNAARMLLRQMIDADPVAMEGVRESVQTLLSSIQAAIEDRLGSDGPKPIDATEFALVLSSTSLVWVASRSAIEGTFGLDTLSAPAIRRHRRTLHALVKQLLDATSEAAQ